MPDWSVGQIRDRVDLLWNSTPMVNYRSRLPKYHQMINATYPVDADMPEHYLKGQIVEMHSPRATRVKRQMTAETSAFPKYVTVAAKHPDGGPVTQPMRARADTVERWDTLCVDRLDAGASVTFQVSDHQVSSGYSVVLLHCNGDEEFPWRLEVCDQMTCAFPVKKGGAFRPKMLARKYRMLVKDAIDAYSERSRGPAKGRKLSYDTANKKLRFEPLAEGTPVEGVGVDSAPQFRGAGEEDFAEELTFLELYTEDMTYHVCLDEDEKDGEVVWSRPNITGGVPCVIVPGDCNAIGGPGEEMLPVMFEVITVLRSRNLCRTLMMTSATQDRPEMAFNVTPEQLEQMRKGGMVVPANDVEMKANGPRALYYTGSGEATGWIAAPNDDLHRIDEQLAVELEAACDALVQSTDTRLAAASTAEAWTTVTESQNRQQTPLLQHRAFMWAEVLRMIHYSVEHYKDEYTLAATSDMKRAKNSVIKNGESVTLSADDAAWVRTATVTVAIKQETEEQQQRRKEQAWADYQRGGITFEQYIAVSYPDTDAQLEELFYDVTLGITDLAFGMAMLAKIVQGDLLTDAGIMINVTADMLAPQLAPPPQPGMPPGGGMPGQPQQMQMPPSDNGMARPPAPVMAGASSF